MRRALLTGATGFLGSRLARHLVGLGWQVHVIVRAGSTLDPLAPVLDRIEVHRVAAHDDLRPIVAAAAPDVVFHLASLFLAAHRSEDVPRLLDSNLVFATRLAEAMSEAGVGCLVNTGTGWEHFRDAGYSPVNLYAASKQAFEVLLQYYVEARGLRVVTLKLYDTYGPDDPRPKLFRLLRELAASGGSLAMSPGEQLLDLVHVDDVVRAYVVAADRVAGLGAGSHERFGLSGGAPLSLRALVALIGEVSGVRLDIDWGARPYRPREVMRPVLLPPLPGWTPARDLRGGIAEVFASA